MIVQFPLVGVEGDDEEGGAGVGEGDALPFHGGEDGLACLDTIQIHRPEEEVSITLNGTFKTLNNNIQAYSSTIS